MSNHYDPEDPAEMDKWTRYYYHIDNESTDAYLVRNGFSADTPKGFVKRMNMALAWMESQITVHTRTIVDEIRAITDEYERVTSPIQPFQAGQLSLPAPPTEAATLQREKAEFLFEQAKAMHRLQPALDAQEKYKQAQSDRASKPRKLTENECQRIAKHYWDSKREGTSYGIVKMLAASYDVSETTIHTITKKYRPK
jgi:hypothetical protein